MKAVVVSDVCGRRAGAYQTTLLLCRELALQEMDVTCFAQTVEGQWIAEDDRFRIVEPLVRRGSRWDWPGRCLARQAIRHIEKNDPNVVFVVGLTRLCGYLLGSAVADQMLVIETTNATPGNKFVDDEAARLLSRCRAILSPAATIDEHIRQTYRYEGPIDRLPFWVEETGAVRDERNTDAPADFLFLGRLDEDKGLQDLLQATASLIKQGSPVRVTVAGPGPRANFETLAVDLGIQEALTFLPVLSPSEVRATLAASRFLVLPSHHEGYPLVLLEAARAGVPFVATRVGAIPEVFGGNEGCVLVEPRDPPGLAQAMEQLLDESREASERRRQAIQRGFLALSSQAVVSRSIGRLLKKYAGWDGLS